MKTPLLTISLLFVSVFGFSQHVYQFNNTLNEAGSGPALTQVFDTTCTPRGTTGIPTTDAISTSAGSSLVLKPVFSFAQNGGLSYPNDPVSGGLGITGTYTIHILYKITDYNQGFFTFQKLIDFKKGSSDDALYTHGPQATPTLVNVIGVAPNNVASITNASNYHLISLIRGGAAADSLEIYIDGAIAIKYNDSTNVYTSTGADSIIFFRDDINTAFPCEAGAGLVRYISLSTSTSTAGQVATFFTNLVSAVLPVNLTAFNAQKNGNSGLLQWQTATEVNAAYYNVERSYDGINFTTISKVNAKGQASNTYSFNDAAGLSSTNTYYRLKIVDNNGNYKYSSVVRLANGQGIKVSVYPNPASDVVTVSGLKANDNIKLLSIDGKLLLQQNASGVQSMMVNIAKYKPGTYILQVKNDTEVSQQKIVKY